MDRRPGFDFGALVALLLLAISTAAAGSQAVPSCTGRACAASLEQPWAGAGVVYQRKQEFVAALRQLSIALAGRFGDEGRTLRSDIDVLEMALERWDQAIVAFEKALQQRGYDPDAHTALGTVYLDRYRIEDALRSFEAAARLDARRADVYQFMAMAHGLANRPSDAVRALNLAADIQPDDAVVRYEIARYAMETGTSPPSSAIFASFQDAADKQLAQSRAEPPFTRPGLLRQVAGVAPIFPPAPYVQTFELLMKGKFEEAIAECRRAISGEPLLEVSGENDPLATAGAALRRGDLSAALKQLRAAVQANPARTEAHRILGLVSRLDEQIEQSLDAYTAAIRMRPTDERSRMGLADVLIDMERFSEAEKVLKETIDALPGSVQAHYKLGRLYQSLGKYPEALKELEYTAQFTPLVGQDPLYEMVALIYASQADFARATEALRKQVAVNPNNADAHRRLADGYVRQERTMEALAEFTAALLIDRRNVLSHVGVSQLHFRAGNHEAAARAARSALQVEPSHSEARYVLAMSLMRLGQTEEGKRELQEFQRLQADAAAATQRKYETDGLTRQIDVATGAGDYQSAIPLLRRLIELAPDVASHYAALGATLAKANQTTEAIQAFEMALERQSSDINVHRQLAEAYLAAGRVDASRREADRYRELIEIAKKQRALRFATP
jgi:tetratricopeptide (TPR) repeat protein